MSEGKEKQGDHLSKSTSKNKPSKEKGANKEVNVPSQGTKPNDASEPSNKCKESVQKDEKSTDKDKESKKDQGQRYYLYDKELKRPAEIPTVFQPRFRPSRPRLPFHMHDYAGIYPTVEEKQFEAQLIARRQREFLIYCRPPDLYHGSSSGSSASRSERSYRYDDRRDRRHDYEYESSRRGRDYDYYDHDYRDGRSRDYYYNSERSHGTSHRESDTYLNGARTAHYSSSTRRRHSEESRGYSRKRTKPSELVATEGTNEGNDSDLSVELFPLMHFIDDKPALLKEAMSILNGKKLKAMIPPMFADLNSRELREACLQELNTLNIATIANVLDGKLVNSELTNLATGKSKGSKKTGVSVTKIKKKLKEVITDGAPPPKKKKKQKPSAGHESKKIKKKHKKKKKKSKGSKNDDDTPAGPGLPPQKTLMELLELEYRAKAIKALLKSQDINVDSSKIDEALKVDPDGFDPGTRPIVADPRPLATPEISTRFLVDNTYIYPMQIKLEYEEPEPPEIIIDETTFPPSPELSLPPPITAPENCDLPMEQCSEVISVKGDNDPANLEGTDVEVIENVENGSCIASNLSFKTSMVISLNDDSDDSENENSDSGSVSTQLPDSAVDASRADERAKILELCQNSENLFQFEKVSINKDIMETDDVSDLEDGEYDDDEEETVSKHQNESDSEKPEPIPIRLPETVEVEDIGSVDEDDDEEVQTYVRHCANGPATTPIDRVVSRDLSPPRKSAVSSVPRRPLFRPDLEVLSSRLSAEDISSDESGEELVDDDGIIIGGFNPDPDADPDPDPISLPLPFHTCEPRPEGYESAADEEVGENEAEEEDDSENQRICEEEEDEDTNPRTWFNRWYHSKKVQKNVKSNRMIAKLRSKLRQEMATPEVLPPQPIVDEVPIIGSISDYHALFNSGKFKIGPPPEEVEEPVEENKGVEESKVVENPVENNDDDDLWGDILG